LPFDVQVEIVHSMRGLERAHILRPGYAIEYDYYDPRSLKHSLESRQIENLFLAGQVNGTTGYEEAAAQGLLAGINAALKVLGHDPWVPGRAEAYLGVLVDDLVTRGVSEPYRMFTSRAEYRLTLREDNADARLTEVGRSLGCVDDRRWAAYSRKREAVHREIERLRSTWVNPRILDAQDATELFGKPLEREYTLADLLRRPEVRYSGLCKLRTADGDVLGGPPVSDPTVADQVEVAVKYAGYIDRQHDEVAKHKASASTRIPGSLDYARVRGLSIEVRQKLAAARPETIGQAARISGVTPAAISLLLVHLKRLSRGEGKVAA
jgi:tRNA uridine 5-carboxymethylaminomethyl modification enzyme